MCGIAGKLYFDKNRRIDANLAHRMCRKLIHRGPDDEGVYEDYNFVFAMRRLSIIDIEGGHQPIFSDDHTIGVVFNGEIYNFKELRKELEEKGYRFKTKTDTEVILRSYEEYGSKCVLKFNGMFAFAVWDAKQQKLFMARDRLGVKPLYYYLDNDTLVFASELKALLEDKDVDKQLDFDALDLYLSFMYIPSPYSIFKKVKKLDPAHTLTYAEGRVSIEKYWDVDFSFQDASKSLTSYKEEFLSLLEDSVRLRMISDVPVGAFLSGGIDSSAVVSCMSRLSSAPVKTFSIGFNKDSVHDETKYAEVVARKFSTDHTVINVDAGIITGLIDYIDCFSEPFADEAAFPTYVLSQAARQKVKVVLTGDGCDEIFAGYKRYSSELLAQRYKMIPSVIRNNVFLPCFEWGRKLSVNHEPMYEFFSGGAKKTKLMSMDNERRYIEGFYNFDYGLKSRVFRNNGDIKTGFSGNYFQDYLKDKQGYDFLSKRLYLDIKTSLAEDMLTKVDRVTMAHSLEARVPFLDYRMVEFSARVPSKYKMDVFHLKKFVRGALQGVLPPEILSRPKHGFSSPIDRWIRDDLRVYVLDYLSQETIRRQGIFNHAHIQLMLDEHMRSQANWGKQLFMLLVFQVWYDRFVKP